MKVLMQSYNTIMQSESGGAQVRFMKLFSEIKKQGVDIKLFDKYSDKLSDFDILHVFHLDTENLSLIRGAKALGKKVVISSIVNTTGQVSLSIHRLLYKSPINTVYKMYRQALELSDLVIAETNAEKRHIVKYYCINPEKIILIPNGADIYEKNNEIFKQTGMDIGAKYVLQVGRFDENKNQLRVIKALKNTDIQVVFMGGAVKEGDEYYQSCLEEAKGCSNIHFLGWVKNESLLFQSAYANATVLAMPSFYETFGLTLVEGGVCGANLAISNRLPVLEYPELKDVITFDPSSVTDIQTKIRIAYENENKELTERMRAAFSWEKVAKEHCKWYTKLCEK